MAGFNPLLTTANSTGGTGFFQNIARYAILAVSAVVGVFVLVLTASAALVVVLSLLFIGLIVFIYFWARAKFFGKTIGGKAFADLQAAAKAHQEAQSGMSAHRTSAADYEGDGDIIDAHEPPDGWTVNE